MWATPLLPPCELAWGLTCWVSQCTRSFFIALIKFAVGFQHNRKAFLQHICVFANSVLWKRWRGFMPPFSFTWYSFHLFHGYFPCLILWKELQTGKWVGFLSSSFPEKMQTTPPRTVLLLGKKSLYLPLAFWGQALVTPQKGGWVCQCMYWCRVPWCKNLHVKLVNCMDLLKCSIREQSRRTTTIFPLTLVKHQFKAIDFLPLGKKKS